MTDQEVAKDVYRTAKRLNEVLRAADKAGLEVEIEIVAAGNMESPKALLVTATVWKRLPE